VKILDKEITKRQLFSYIIGSFLLLLFVVALMCPVDEPLPTTIQSEQIHYTETIPTPTPIPLSIEDQTKWVNAIRMSFGMFTLDRKLKEITITNDMDDFETYEALDHNQKLYKDIGFRIMNMKVPEELPEPLKQKLVDVREECWMAYYARADFDKKKKKYLDDKKPSTLKKSMDCLSRSIKDLAEITNKFDLIEQEFGLLELNELK